MKLGLLVPVCAATALFASFGPNATRASTAQSDSEKIAILEKDLVSTRTRVERLAQELKEARELVHDLVQYQQAQARSAQSLAAQLDASEEAGFTFGINPRSREILLAAWREQIAEAQKNLPGAVQAPSTNGANGSVQR